MSARFPNEAEDPRESFGTVPMPALMAIAGIGLALSVVVHAAAILGLRPPFGHLVMMLHLGVFVVWIATIFALRAKFPSDQLFPSVAGKRDLPLKHLWPAWAQRTFAVLFAYTLINFVACASQLPPRPARSSQAHRARAHEPSPLEYRAFSSHWLLFYGVAFVTLLAASGVDAGAKSKPLPDDLDGPLG